MGTRCRLASRGRPSLPDLRDGLYRATSGLSRQFPRISLTLCTRITRTSRTESRREDGADKETYECSGERIASVEAPKTIDSVHQIVDVRGIDLPESDIPRVKNHLAKYYKKMGETAPWERH